MSTTLEKSKFTRHFFLKTTKEKKIQNRISVLSKTRCGPAVFGRRSAPVAHPPTHLLACPRQLRWLAVPSTCQHTHVLANAKTLTDSPATRASPGGSNNTVALHMSLSFYYIDNAFISKKVKERIFLRQK